MISGEDIAQLIRQPETVRQDMLDGLDELCKKFPYSSSLHILYLKGLSLHKDIQFEEILKRSASHAVDRERLYELIQTDEEATDIQRAAAETTISEETSTVEEVIETQEEIIDAEDTVTDTVVSEETATVEEIVEEKELETESENDVLEEEAVKEIQEDPIVLEEDTPTEIETAGTKQESEKENVEEIVFETENITLASEEEEIGDTSTPKEAFSFELNSEEIEEKEEVVEEIQEEEKITESEEELQTETTVEDTPLEKEIISRAFDLAYEYSSEELIEEPLKAEETNEEEEDDSKEEILEEDEIPIEALDLENMSFIDWLKFKQGQEIEDHKSSKKKKKKKKKKHKKEKKQLKSNTSKQEAVLEEKEEQSVEDKPLTKSEILDKFIEEEPSISKPVKEFYSPSKNAKESLEESDEIVSETLAEIHVLQKNFGKAIETYRKLMALYPEKKVIFASRIEKINADLRNK